MKNIFIKTPNKGDIVVKDITTKTPRYIVQSTYDGATLGTGYEVIGVVGNREGNKVLVVYKTNQANLKWCDRAYWLLTGWLADGIEHIFTLHYWSTETSFIDVAINYTGSDINAVVASLNTKLSSISETNFITQRWVAEKVGNTIELSCNNLDYRQLQSNSITTSGVSIVGIPNVLSFANMCRKHGGKGGEGALSSYYRALLYFRDDNTLANYNPTNVLANIKTTYPVCLPAYLGTSVNRDGDKCAILRSTYGEGESGWNKYMKAQMPVRPTDYGNMGENFGKEMGIKLGVKLSGGSVAHPASAYAYNLETATISKGEFWLPTVEELSIILSDIQYTSYSNDRNSDAINKGLLIIGGSSISNGTHWWSCCRYSSYYAWYAHGFGRFGNDNLYGAFSCVPVSLYNL